MTRTGSPRMRWVSFMGLAMLLMSITPFGVAAQVGLTPAGEVAQEAPSADAPMGMGIELLLVVCAPGSPEDAGQLRNLCTDGPAGIDIEVTSVDPALNVDLPKTSVKPGDPGPGVINTGELPVGEYRFELDIPEGTTNYVFACHERGNEGAVVPTAPSPDGADNVFLVENRADVDVVCRAFLISTEEVANPEMEITYRECERGDLPGDDRSFEALRDNCTDVSTDPPTFNVRHLHEAGQPVTEHQQDAQGVVNLTLNPGDFDMFTDLDMDEWGEYLFCEYEGQPLYEKDFDPQRGITTFMNLLHGEEFTCNWFGVSASEGTVSDTPADEIVDEQEDSTSGEEPEDLTSGEEQDANGEQDQNAQNQQPQIEQQQEADEVTFNIAFNECTRGDLDGDDRSFGQLEANCTYFEAPGPTITITETDGTSSELQFNDAGLMTFTREPADFNIHSNLDLDQWGEYLFCTVDGGERYQKHFELGMNGFFDLDGVSVIDCDWFAVNASFDPTEGQAPPVVDPDPVNASFTLSLSACETDVTLSDPVLLDELRTNCVFATNNVVVALADDVDVIESDVTDVNGEASFEDVPAGNWRIWTDIPLEAATEYFFCSVDGGAYEYVPVDNRGVAGFAGIDGEQIDCEVYIVPENLRGEITGSSVEVHLSLCPAHYDGTNWYGDCHDEGIGEMPFVLTGPMGEIEAETVVERTPGPGIVRFTELAAGEYQLAGGPPQHDGDVFLYCSDPATNAQVETVFEGGMGYFQLAENQSIVCDWYFVPTTVAPVTPTPEPTRAEIFTTMFICPPDVNVAGSTFSQLDSACDQRLSDVPMTLQSPGGVPITANTGESGEGAIRFYDLTGGNYVLTPKLPAEYVSAAVYCDLDGGPVYQKVLENGATTFVNVEGELISCSWFVTAKPQPAPGPTPTGSITVREMLCEEDRSVITDWERECEPGPSGVSFTVTSVGGDVTQTVTPNDEGVAVFAGLPNEYYELVQSEGAWCRARAERVDSQSRIIVSGGGNTDVFIYQCNQELGLPDTGTGPVSIGNPVPMTESMMLGAAALPLLAAAAWQIRRWQMAAIVSEPLALDVPGARTRTSNGYRYR